MSVRSGLKNKRAMLRRNERSRRNAFFALKKAEPTISARLPLRVLLPLGLVLMLTACACSSPISTAPLTPAPTVHPSETNAPALRELSRDAQRWLKESRESLIQQLQR